MTPSITEQLDALVEGHDEIKGFTVITVAAGYYCSIWGPLGVAVSMRATLPEAAEQATVEAMALIHEGRG